MLFDERKNDGGNSDENEEGAESAFQGNDGLLPGDLVMKAFKHVTNEFGEGKSYIVTIKNKEQLDFVRELVAACLSFRQVSKVVKSGRENLQAASKVPPVCPGEVTTLAGITCAIQLQAMSEVMKNPGPVLLPLMSLIMMVTLTWILEFDSRPSSDMNLQRMSPLVSICWQFQCSCVPTLAKSIVFRSLRYLIPCVKIGGRG